MNFVEYIKNALAYAEERAQYNIIETDSPFIFAMKASPGNNCSPYQREIEGIPMGAMGGIVDIPYILVFANNGGTFTKPQQRFMYYFQLWQRTTEECLEFEEGGFQDT